MGSWGKLWTATYKKDQNYLTAASEEPGAKGGGWDGRVMVERSDRMWSTGEGNGKPLQ